ncbi:hypothetical protein ACFE04_000784 [Oxalis oulophora]
MDPYLRGFSGTINGGSQAATTTTTTISILPDGNFVVGGDPRFQNTFIDRDFRGFTYLNTDPPPTNLTAYSSNVADQYNFHEEESSEDCDFSDSVLRYVSKMLMEEEEMEEKTSSMLQGSVDLQAAEKSFYDVLGKKYPPSPEYNTCLRQNSQFPDESIFSNGFSFENSGYNSTRSLVDGYSHNLATYGASQLPENPSYAASSSSGSVVTNADSPNSILHIPDLNGGNSSVWQFQKGVEEANKFLPDNNGLFINLESDVFLQNSETADLAVKVEKKNRGEYLTSGSRGRQNLYTDGDDLEEVERSNKQVAISADSPLRSEMFDRVLLTCTEEGRYHMEALREALKSAATKNVVQEKQIKGAKRSGKGRGRKPSGKKEVIDLRSLLINCAQAVAADDRRSANELIKQIRQHSSPYGDGNQRLAQCFADSLEARLAGTGSQIYRGLIGKKTPASDLLKAYHLYLAACPFRKLSNFCSNRTIQIVAANAKKVHIIDFGILYGFQWPTLIERLSARPGGPPKLRITGIEFPQPGFRPAERVEETGRRLAAYANEYNVPFEYRAIANKWETIKIEELKIEKDEVLIINCLYRGRNLLDETVAVDGPRNNVLKFIKKINPDIFIHGIVNGAYSAPFFVTRFREVLFHFSALFDMLETIVPRSYVERLLLEKEVFGKEALNVIACEGYERVERPETYKQWQVRNFKAGFVQLPFERAIKEKATFKVRTHYHKDFLIDEDGRWLLLGWKGRIIYSLSLWKPS